MSRTSDEVVLFHVDELRTVSESILVAVGTPDDLASIVAGSLVDANLAGHDSHGVLRLPTYVAAVRNGQVIPAARPQFESLGGACGQVDGAWGWGQPAVHLATDHAIGLAATNGVALVSVSHCNHAGRLGEYVERIARSGQIGSIVCNSKPAVAPHGGYTRMLGTNPVAWSVPTPPGEPPVVIDFATSMVAEGKLKVARAAAEDVPAGALLDSQGRPTQDPSAFYEGGALMTFGGHKGYGMSVMVELMGGILSGSGPSCLPGYDNGYGTVIIAIDVDRFSPKPRFMAQVEAFCHEIRSAPPAPGFDAVLTPGEPEWRSRASRLDLGIEIPASTRKAIIDVAASLSLQLPW